MNKNGFTLVELLAVITLMGLVAIASFEILDSVNKENKVKTENSQIKSILSSAISYVPTSDVKLPNKIGDIENRTCSPIATYKLNEESEKIIVAPSQICVTEISLRYLVEEGILEDNIKNPITGNYYDLDESVVRIFLLSDKTIANSKLKVSASSISKTEDPWKYDGNYLYYFVPVE